MLEGVQMGSLRRDSRSFLARAKGSIPVPSPLPRARRGVRGSQRELAVLVRSLASPELMNTDGDMDTQNPLKR